MMRRERSRGTLAMDQQRLQLAIYHVLLNLKTDRERERDSEVGEAAWTVLKRVL